MSGIPSYLDVLNEEQRAAVVHEGSPLLILAGAGSGKTRVITTKIAYLIGEKEVDPYQILAVTFTKKAANEMLQRAVSIESRAKYSQIRTFHSFGAWFLRLNAEAAGIEPNFTVYDDDDMVTLVSKSNPLLTRQQSSHFAHIISLCKDYCIMPKDELAIKQVESDPDFPQIYLNYTNRLRETGNVDFGDLILLPMLVLKTNEEIRARIQDRFRVIMVDEYQDSNVAQFRLLQFLAGSQTYVCVVGDDDQSIYKFRGAEIQNILQFKNQFPGTDVIRLESNYRSKEPILLVANDIVKNNTGRLGKSLRSERGKGKKPVLAFLQNQDIEAQFCADLVSQAHDMGVHFSDWAILYRTNAQSMGFESEFLRRKIPYKVVGSLKFYEREEIKDILAYLSLLANPRDEIAFRRIINKPARGIGVTTQDKLVDSFRNGEARDYVDSCIKNGASLSKKAREGAAAFAEVMDSLKKTLGSADKNLSVLVDAVADKSGLREYHAGQDEISGTQREANIQELSNSAVPYKATMEGLLDFLDNIELDRTLENNEDEGGSKDCVTLITLHNTKGLEFSRVIMTGMELGVFPRADKEGDELEEERRLCYVGVTRAKDELYMTACAMRRMYGHTEYMSPSPFLQEIEPDNIRIIGHLPFGFRKSGSDRMGDSHNGDFGALGLSHPDTETDPVKRKYSRGAKVYHDDYGYGVITSSSSTDDGEYVITVGFENGGTKKFLPKYQQAALMVIKD